MCRSPLSTNALLIAPNIIVLDRLRTDFDGGRIFNTDPILPTNGYEGRDWTADFQLIEAKTRKERAKTWRIFVQERPSMESTYHAAGTMRLNIALSHMMSSPT